MHLWEKRDTPEAKQLIRYTMVSVVSTVVSFGVLAFVFGVLHLWGEIGSTVFANVVATVPSYFLNRKWVWGKGGRSHLMKEIVPFWVMSAIGIVVSIGGAAVARHIGIEHHLSHFEQTVVVLAANLALLRPVLGAQVHALQPAVPCAPGRGARRAGGSGALRRVTVPVVIPPGFIQLPPYPSDGSRPSRRSWRGHR